MNKTITIKNNIKIKNEVQEFLCPDYVYIPIEEDDKVLVEIGSDILKEQEILKNKKRIEYSPISGKIIGINENMYIHNNKIKTLIIENNFKEKTSKNKGVVKYINEYTTNELIELVNKYNACNRKLNKKANTLIINGIDSDPFEKTYSYLINNCVSKILETIDALQTILNIKNTFLCINNHDNNNVINLTSNIGTYPNIKLKMLPDIYPIGYKKVVIQNTLNKKQLSEGYIYLTVEDIFNIYTVLKRKKSITEKLVTISGNAIEESMVAKVKIGTSIEEIIKNCCEITKENHNIIINGLIAGETLKSKDTPVTLDIKSIFINTINKEKEKKCINCGLCCIKCPVGLNPKYIKEHPEQDSSRCIGCGLCTYICPSKINFKEYLGGKDE